MPKELDISEDEESILPGLGEDDDDSSVVLEDSEDAAEEQSEEEDDDAKFSLVESSDGEDLIPLDEAQQMAFQDGPMDWPDERGSDSEDEEWAGFGNGSPALGEKRKRKSGGEQKRRKKVRSLPTFASYEDYAKLIEKGPEDDI